jgi:hypothetical protein
MFLPSIDRFLRREFAMTRPWAGTSRMSVSI